jgi:Helix-turn-helix domain
MQATDPGKRCATCPTTIHLKYGKYCDPCRAKVRRERKYLFTDQIDRLIREIYLSHPGTKTRPGIRMLAKKVGIPHWALKKRARELGLARTKELPWSEPELQILARYAWMSDERIRLKLKAAGYSRTVTGIHLKLRRMKFKHDPSFYSANGLARALGIDAHTVSRWIRRGHLKAQLRGTARGNRQNGDIYLIREKDVRRFILEHPTEIDLRKVDQLWFLDLLTNGFTRSV